ncbi:globin domain-containing protein [Yoonia sediminilitoris]|uniref:Nitric oxide dioxygenase n=1 Tax=Yoonia sediminilitoris TaxID=1286148 RepID=A0A2T6KMU4_9RHOB|nr:globin domain-containing protein [Yoonia sediminilitoris]PUB17501.1 nitric oxide dioxygenase [Yoonia sediminilitoris]RCW97796.1 nitric oxide dioxygenase [Yoonia sediminilitoris]
MTRNHIETVKDSFHRVFPVRNALSQTFYDELFRIAPSIRPFFPEDMIEQRIKLSETLTAVVQQLHQLHPMEDTIIGLARQHLGHGTKPEHFAPVGAALIHALDTHSHGGLSEVEQDAWLSAYGAITDLMVEAMFADVVSS